MSGDRSGDTSGDLSGDGRWLTYDELAKARRISRTSAERLVLRNRWRRQRGNDRTVRVLVPLDHLSGDLSADTPDASPDVSGDVLAVFTAALAAIEAAHQAALVDFREAHAGETAALRVALGSKEGEAEVWRGLADARQAALDRECARAERAEQGRDAER